MFSNISNILLNANHLCVPLYLISSNSHRVEFLLYLCVCVHVCACVCVKRDGLKLLQNCNQIDKILVMHISS